MIEHTNDAHAGVNSGSHQDTPVALDQRLWLYTDWEPRQSPTSRRGQEFWLSSTAQGIVLCRLAVGDQLQLLLIIN